MNQNLHTREALYKIFLEDCNDLGPKSMKQVRKESSKIMRYTVLLPFYFQMPIMIIFALSICFFCHYFTVHKSYSDFGALGVFLLFTLASYPILKKYTVGNFMRDCIFQSSKMTRTLNLINKLMPFDDALLKEAEINFKHLLDNSKIFLFLCGFMTIILPIVMQYLHHLKPLIFSNLIYFYGGFVFIIAFFVAFINFFYKFSRMGVFINVIEAVLFLKNKKLG